MARLLNNEEKADYGGGGGGRGGMQEGWCHINFLLSVAPTGWVFT